jgi:hypothetical protein
VIGATALFPFFGSFALIVAVPTPIPRTRPALVTVAIVVFELVHSSWTPSIGVPAMSLATAVSWAEPPTLMDGVEVVISIDSIESAGTRPVP